MKKIYIIAFALASLLSLFSCEQEKAEPSNTADTEETVNHDTSISGTTESTDISETQDTSVDNYDIQAIIDENLDILSSDPYSSKSEQEVIDTYPDNFSAIVSLGKAALPYLEQCASDTDNAETMSDTLRAIIAKKAAYSIDPSLYDLVFESPDGKSRIIASVRAFADDHAKNPEITYGKLSLDNAGSIRQIESPEFNFTDVNAAWSNDNRYAVIFGTQKEDRFPVIALFVDTADGSLVTLPSLDIYNYILEKEPDLKSFLSFTARSCKWYSGNPTIEFELSVGAAFYPQAIHGSYTFDSETGELSNLVYDTIQTKTTKKDLSDDEIKKIVDENLDILMAYSGRPHSEQKIIDAHPEAFANIVALGSGALPYLKEIGNGYNYVGEDTSGNSRCFMAKAAAYVIDPNNCDSVFPSPDGQYAVKSAIHTFFFLADPFRGIEYKLYLINAETDEVLAASDSAYCIYSDPFGDADIKWSPDGKYASLQESYRHMYTYVYIFDTVNPAFYSLPDEYELENIFGTKLELEGNDGGSINNFHCYIEEWEDGKAKVQIILSDNASEGKLFGWYLFDLENRNITDFGLCD